MPRPKANPEQNVRAYQLWRDGSGPTAIADRLEEEFARPVSDRTIANWIKDFKKLKPETVDLDAPFEWGRMDRYGIPWEASSFLMSMLAKCASEALGANRLNRTSDAPRGALPMMAWLSVRQARWCWRVYLAAPEVLTGELQPQQGIFGDLEVLAKVNLPDRSLWGLRDIWILANQFNWREVKHEVLMEPLDLADLEALLVFKPWLSEAHDERYHEAVDIGLIPPLDDSMPVIFVNMEVSKDADVNSGIHERPISSSGRPYRLELEIEHPDLLLSQQVQAIIGSPQDTSFIEI